MAGSRKVGRRLRYKRSQRAGHDFVLSEALKTWQWYALWLLLFLNTCAGISIISQEAPIFQELTGASAIVAAGMVGLASIGNAVGRVFWGFRSDHAASNLRGHVRSSGPAFLVFSEHRNRLFADDRYVRRADVLRRRVWHHARVRG